MDAATLPVWAQTAGSIAIVIVSAIIGVISYLKKQSKEAVEPGNILSASFIDSKLVRELIEALREHQEESGRDIKKVLRTTQDLRDAVLENTEAVIVQTDSTTNMLKFITRMTRLPHPH